MNPEREGRLLGVIKQFRLENGGACGYRKIHHELRDLGERCGKHRVARLMVGEGLKLQTGGPAAAFEVDARPSWRRIHLQQRFDVSSPNQAWVTDITYIRTHDG